MHKITLVESKESFPCKDGEHVLGAMVHPMRLTFVEFFKNSGYEGGGKEYKPFRN